MGIGILRKLKIENDHLEKFLRESYEVLKNHIYESKEQVHSFWGLKCELFLDNKRTWKFISFMERTQLKVYRI